MIRFKFYKSQAEAKKSAKGIPSEPRRPVDAVVRVEP